MSEPKVFVDYEFHFERGEVLAVTVRESVDRVQSIDGLMSIEITEGDVTRTLVIHKDKLNAVQMTRRIEKAESPRPLVDVNGAFMSD